MIKRISVYIFAWLFLMNAYGCFALLAGAAGGAGAAVWLSGKLTQEINVPYERAITATRSALKSLKLEITKEAKTENVAQIKSKYANGKEVWIDIRPITKSSSRIEVRVGAVSSDKEAADKILKRIMRYL